MATGSDILGQLQHQQRACQQDLQQLTQVHQQNAQALRQAQAEATQALQQLAASRLDALASRELLTPLGDADARAQQALARRASELERVTQELQRNATAQQHARDDVVTHDAREAACGADAERALEALLGKLRAEPTFAQSERAAADARALAERTQARLAELEALRTTHAPAFEADVAFMYLWNRSFGTPRYRGWGLARVLDRWLARRIGYGEEAGKFRELTVVPGLLAQHVAELQADAETKTAAVDAQIEAAMPRDPAGTAREVYRTAQRQAEGAHAHLAQLVDAQQALDAERTRLTTHTDEHSVDARRALFEAIERLDRAALLQAAGSTRTTEDDTAAARLVALRDRLPQLEATLASSAAAVDAQQAKVTEAAGVIAEFRRRGFDRSNARFSGLDVNSLLLGYLAGSHSRQSFWDQVSSRHSVYTPPAPSISTSSGGGYRSSGGFGGGSRSGGSRGGGYRTSGGF